MKMHRLFLITLSSAAFMACSAHAQEGVLVAPSAKSTLPVARNGEIIDSVGGGAIDAILPVVQKKDGISFITGGVGEEDMAEMKTQAANFNVRILLSSVSGEYMSDVAIRFLNEKGAEVLRVNSVGPFFYVNLPAGKYTVEAVSLKGTLESAKITAPAKIPASGRIVIRFKE